MSKEIAFKPDFPIIDSNNCYISSLATILNLCGIAHLNTAWVEFSLPATNDHYATNFLAVLRDLGLSKISHDVIEVAKRRALLFRVISQALQGGAVCELSVYSHAWLEDILHEKDVDISGSELHSIVLYGYYQPEDDLETGYFYVMDSYNKQKLFLDWEQIFPLLEQEKGWVWLHLYNLCLDPHDLAHFYSVKKFTLNKPTRNEIYERIPGNSPAEKLSYLLEKTS